MNTKTILGLLIASFLIIGCEPLAQLPEKVCIKTHNVSMWTNGTDYKIGDGQVEIQLSGCDTDTG